MTMIGHAYSLLEVKSFNDDLRVIEGIATTPITDRMDDIVESRGAQFKLPMPLLWQHHTGEPVGHVEYAEIKDNGIPFRARIAKIEEPGELKNLVDKAWQAVKSRLVRGVSIGFRSLEDEQIDSDKGYWGGTCFKKWEWLELSLVTVPANADASIQTIRSIATAARNGEEIGQSRPAKSTSHVVKAEQIKMAKKSTAEQISAFEATRQAKAARMTEIMEKASEEGITLDQEQQTEY